MPPSQVMFESVNSESLVAMFSVANNQTTPTISPACNRQLCSILNILSRWLLCSVLNNQTTPTISPACSRYLCSILNVLRFWVKWQCATSLRVFGCYVQFGEQPSHSNRITSLQLIPLQYQTSVFFFSFFLQFHK